MDEVEDHADKLIADYFSSLGHPLTLPIPVEDIAEHHLGYTIDFRNDGLFSDPELLGEVCRNSDAQVIGRPSLVQFHDYSCVASGVARRLEMS